MKYHDGLLEFTPNLFVTFRNEWGQIGQRYNWYSITPFQLSFENEKWTGGFEGDFILLGLGLHFRWNYDPSKLDWMLDSIPSSTKPKKKKNVKK